MSLFKKVRKAASRALRATGRIAKQGIMRDSKMLSGPFGGMAGSFGGGEKEEPEEEAPPSELGQRSEAAKRLAEIQKQAGGGQIKYNTMTTEEEK